MLPHEFPPWGTVWYYFRQWRIDETWHRIHSQLYSQVRQLEGRQCSPSAAIIDSQSVKTTEQGGPRGYDAGKNVNGRKRHIIVDTIGLLLAVVVHAASIQDRDGAKLVLRKLKGKFPRLKLIWADGGYCGSLVNWVLEFGKWILEIVSRPKDQKGFVVLPRRWVVERTFAWLSRNRRLSKDYERLCDTSETMIKIAMIHLMLKRLPVCSTPE
tara:strand:- start:44 stop:679 length:636 start_codon:yes stop_codon:yes gene_type:complete